MSSGKVNLHIDQGATFTRRFVWKAGEPLEIVDLTGLTARMQIRPTSQGDLLVSLTTENGGITLGGEDGTIDLLISAADTSAFTWTKAVYDLEIVYPDARVRRLLSGNVTLSREVTR